MQVLIACQVCGKQYDLTGLEEEDLLHCACGHALQYQAPRVHRAKIVKCPNCGGGLTQDDRTCAHCGTMLSLSDKGWGGMCPCCFARLPKDARFCVACGVAISPEKYGSKASLLACPRCQHALRTRPSGPINLEECPGCGGLWVPLNAFEQLVEERSLLAKTRQALLGQTRGKRRKFELTAEENVRYIPCPQCQDLMNRRNFGVSSGVIIDSCRTHGIWLDNQELGSIVNFLEQGGAEKAVDAERRQRLPPEAIRLDPSLLLGKSEPERQNGFAEALNFVVRLLRERPF